MSIFSSVSVVYYFIVFLRERENIQLHLISPQFKYSRRGGLVSHQSINKFCTFSGCRVKRRLVILFDFLRVVLLVFSVLMYNCRVWAVYGVSRQSQPLFTKRHSRAPSPQFCPLEFFQKVRRASHGLEKPRSWMQDPIRSRRSFAGGP